jgi:acyl-CoA dehydrogenase
MSAAHEELRRGVREVCARFPNEYWRELDAERRYPEEFVGAMGEAGYLAALIPEEYGGMGLDLLAACAILEEVNRSGANAVPPTPRRTRWERFCGTGRSGRSASICRK